VKTMCGPKFINVEPAFAIHFAQYENRTCGWRFEGICCLHLRCRTRRSGCRFLRRVVNMVVRTCWKT